MYITVSIPKPFFFFSFLFSFISFLQNSSSFLQKLEVWGMVGNDRSRSITGRVPRLPPSPRVMSGYPGLFQQESCSISLARTTLSPPCIDVSFSNFPSTDSPPFFLVVSSHLSRLCSESGPSLSPTLKSHCSGPYTYLSGPQ